MADKRKNFGEKIGVTPRREFWIRALFYYAPLVAAIFLALFLATSRGDYNTSLCDLYAFFAFLGPEYPRPSIESMYGINAIARRLAYLVQYAIITALLVRALQSGRPRLRRRSILTVLLIGVVVITLDNAMRNRTPGRHGGWDDILLSLVAVILTTGIIIGYIAIKNWEQDRLHDSCQQSPSE